MHLSVKEILTAFFLLLAHLEVVAVPHNNVTFVPVDATTINVKQTAMENDRTPFGRISEANNLNRNKTAESRKRFQKTMDAIFNDYRKYLSPTEGVLSASCWLNVTTAPVALIELAELDERLSTILDFQLKWSDERLAWNITETEWYYVPHDPNMIWTPKIEIGNPHDTKVAQSSKSQRNVLNVIYDGSVSWRFVRPIDTICEVDSTYYPFDRQICEIDLKVSPM
ncbi:ACHG-like protein [Mya arenaria]|uniref:ACHG-like protein n=1 Tax=Mya arenaria TaxID=6604 RepID=A0ABY7E5S6_MYAAR|nr:ACHG-like protein [Mya arenaria]